MSAFEQPSSSELPSLEGSNCNWNQVLFRVIRVSVVGPECFVFHLSYLLPIQVSLFPAAIRDSLGKKYVLCRLMPVEGVTSLIRCP